MGPTAVACRQRRRWIGKLPGGAARLAPASLVPGNGVVCLLEASGAVTIGKRMIGDALAQTAGIQVRAADRLGIDQRDLGHRIEKDGIDDGAFKRGRGAS